MKTALVLGGARTIWADVEAALELGEFDGVVGCNDVGIVWPGVMDAWVSLHGNNLKAWAHQRQTKGHPPHAALYGHTEAAAVTHVTPYKFPGQDHSGSSGLFALKVALIDLGFDRAVLCGVPMIAEHNHFFDPRAWDGARHHQIAWRECLAQIKDRARSMSGWTSELLGRPDAAWLSST